MSGNVSLHGHDDPHAQAQAQAQAQAGSLRDYVTGFALAVVFTAIPFWLVMHHTFSRPAVTAAIILVFAAVQMVIHMVYFLHMNSRSEGGWTLLALLFTVMLVIIALSGSLWVMYHLNENMMPAGMGDRQHTPDSHGKHDMPNMHDMPNGP
jgi:cytochrome o ubiquinol oxidase operon protein cyoD